MKLIFKKVFGFDFVPTDLMVLLVEMQHTTFEVRLRNGVAQIYAGALGGTELECRAVDPYLSTGNRPFVGKIPSLNIEFELADDVPNSLKIQDAKLHVADEFVAQHVPSAIEGLRAFLEGYQDAKYLRHRRTKVWIEKKAIVPMVPDSELRTLLFYTLDDTFVGSFSDGRVRSSEASGGDFTTELQASLRQPLMSVHRFVRNAWLQFFVDDFAGAVLYAAIGAERALATIVRDELTTRDVGTHSQVGKIVDDTSNRLLCSAVLGIFGIATYDLRNRLVALFEIRNRIAHGLKIHVSQDDALESLDAAEEFLDIFQKWKASRDSTAEN